LRISLIDKPVARSAHSIPTPLGGGLAIVCLVLLAISQYYRNGLVSVEEFAAVMAAGIVALIGIVDDFRSLNIGWRISAQFFASIGVIYFLGDVPAIDFGFMQMSESLLLNVLAVFSLIWLLNLFNFMDGIDGLAGGQLFFVSILTLFIVISSDNVLILLSATFAAAAAGFLFWNWPPAKIFMGDVGSSFIGFSLGVMALLSMHHGSMTVWTWVLLLGVFVVDATLTLAIRFKDKKRWYEGHATHAYQNAARYYKSHAKVTITLLLINFLWLGPLAWLTVQYTSAGLYITIIGLLPLVLLALRFGAGKEQFTL
jgi:Fuc2NAc and GlcNAc transferase